MHCVTVDPNLLAVSDEDGGIMILNTSKFGTQSIVQGKIGLIHWCQLHRGAGMP